jgi:PilZ domain-containing protein
LAALAENIGTVVHLHTVGNTALAPQVANEGRIAPRRRMLKSGRIAYADRHVTIECLVRDMSATGARLKVSGSVTAPDTFELLIALDGLEANCQVVWRSGQDIGVKFLGAPRIVGTKRGQSITAMVPTRAPTLRRKPRPGEAG